MRKSVRHFGHDAIEIKKRSLRVVEGACRSCHADIVQAIEGPQPGERACIRCHASAGLYKVVELTDETEDPAVWGKNFPMQYDMYLRTVDMKRTLYGGAQGVNQGRQSGQRDADGSRVHGGYMKAQLERANAEFA